jgi:hypothetical protein
MSIANYWNLPPSGKDRIVSDATPIAQPTRCKTVVVKPDENPCIALNGTGPDGAICRTCVHCRYPKMRRTRYWKCDLRTLTHGRGTDHKVGWPACGRYEERTEAYHGG